MAQLKPFRGDYYLWYYVPNIGAAVVFLLFFGVATVFHTYRLIKTRRTWFCIPFAVGGVYELYGYGGRIGAHKNTASLFAYAISNDGVLLAPALFAASVYMTLGRVIRALKGERFSIIRITWLTKAFVIGDILSFVVQGSSIGLSITGYDTGAKAVVLLGLFIQLISFGLFGVTAVVFYQRIMKYPTSRCFDRNLPWERTLQMLFGVSALIIVRSLYRVIEYAMGTSEYLLQHEWPMYIFDTFPMLVVMIVFYVWYPSRIRQQDPDENRSSTVEMMGNVDLRHDTGYSPME
ncbi:putative RTA1 domain protein [Aspergillus ellipticus CBS 707.79]|uniref:Putative RTA1 domain protein n=1 Tax=Aspergillus ellipticus CBS 707.79 TaxID=1448320 RepID=A0A319DEF3_9EURO|nr:putative RTA1 domain protein [Aspergillus ellipticus CBS 707.79]